MKTKIFIFCALVSTILFTGCNNIPEPEVTTTEGTPHADFRTTANGLIVTFQNLSTNAKSYVWTFGDGTTSTNPSPVKKYAKDGTYEVTLTATNITKTDTYRKNVTVKNGTTQNTNTTPEAYFSYTIMQPLKVVLTNKSSSATSYSWDFGDGSTSTEKSPTHRYNSKGVYKVILTAKSGSKTDTYSTNVKIEEPTKCYCTGFDFIGIPKNNEYYQISLTDKWTVYATYYKTTPWVLLSSANMPYSYIPKNRSAQLTSNNYWVTYYQNSSSSGNGTQIARWEFSKKDLYKSFPEYHTFSVSEDVKRVKVYFEWE